MLKYIFAFFILFHGIIHLMGFAKAFAFGDISQSSKNITKPFGLIWLCVACLFVITLYLFFYKSEHWPVFAIIAAIISQLLILTLWKDAKYGTIANIIIVVVAILSWGSHHFEMQFKNDVENHLAKTKISNNDLLTEADIESLPAPVQKYIRYAGALHKPKVNNVRIEMQGEMRSKKKDWFPFSVVQYNFFNEPTRLFFMKAKMFGITVPGYHDYQDATASMNVKLFGMFSVVHASGKVMNRAETVTVFNDMCMMVPATLIDKRIEWIPIDRLSAKASFTNGTNKIAAMLYFNELGQLVNFISDDRSDINVMKQYRFSTPAKEYMQMNGNNVMKYGEAVWHYPEGEFVYGKFNLKSIEYNVKEYKP